MRMSYGASDAEIGTTNMFDAVVSTKQHRENDMATLPSHYKAVPQREIDLELLLMNFEKLVKDIRVQGIPRDIKDTPCLIVAVHLSTIERYERHIEKFKETEG